MSKTINATFDDENLIQKAIDQLEENGADINNAVVYSGGESLKNQTFKNKKTLFGSATGIEYNVWGQRVGFMEDFLHPTSLVLLSGYPMGISHNFALDTSYVEPKRKKPTDNTVRLSIQMPDAEVSEARKILRKNGGRRIYIN